MFSQCIISCTRFIISLTVGGYNPSTSLPPPPPPPTAFGLGLVKRIKMPTYHIRFEGRCHSPVFKFNPINAFKKLVISDGRVGSISVAEPLHRGPFKELQEKQNAT